MRTSKQRKASIRNFYIMQITGMITILEKITYKSNNLVIRGSINSVRWSLVEILNELQNSNLEDWHE